MGVIGRIRTALVILALLHGAVVFAGFLAPYPYAEQHRDYPCQRKNQVRCRNQQHTQTAPLPGNLKAE